MKSITLKNKGIKTFLDFLARVVKGVKNLLGSLNPLKKKEQFRCQKLSMKP